MKILTCLISMLIFQSTQAHVQNFYAGAPLEIIKIGHPTLTMIADEVDHEEINTQKFQFFIDDLMKTMKSAGGVGIAAPQVNRSMRMFIIKPSFFKGAEAIINPVVEYLSDAGKKSSSEGCLSIPGKTFKVDRYKEIKINYFNRDGDFKAEHAKGFRAVVMQHEYDHLNGIMISDFFTKSLNTTDSLQEFMAVPRM
jgi:peptide deformylase